MHARMTARKIVSIRVVKIQHMMKNKPENDGETRQLRKVVSPKPPR